MIREKETYPIVKEFKSWFWRECRFCGKEYKKETMYKIEDEKACRASNSPPTYISYCCNHCADNKDMVKELIKQTKIDFTAKRPPMPPVKQPKINKEEVIK